MTSLLARMGAWLVEPGADGPVAAPRRVAAAPGRAPELAVLAGPGEALALASALAVRVARGTAVVGAWAATARMPSLPATPATRRLASSLAARGLPGVTAGRLVTVPLADAIAAERLCGAVADAPVVLAIAGPRDASWDRVIVTRDLVVVHARHGAFADLAVARITHQGATAARLDATPAAPARVLARAGLALPGGLSALAPLAQAVGR
jgi:hypothetical protein